MKDPKNIIIAGLLVFLIAVSLMFRYYKQKDSSSITDRQKQNAQLEYRNKQLMSDNAKKDSMLKIYYDSIIVLTVQSKLTSDTIRQLSSRRNEKLTYAHSLHADAVAREITNYAARHKGDFHK